MKHVKRPGSASAGVVGLRIIDRFPAKMRLQLAIQAAVFCATLSTIYLVFRFYSPLPRWDHWEEFRWLKNYYAGQWHVSDLWRQHNEHRILFPRLFILADLFLFKGRSVFLLISMLVLQATHCSIFWQRVRAERSFSPEEKLFLWSLFPLLLFSPAQLENLTAGFQICFILVFLAGTVSVASLLKLAETWKYSRASRRDYGWFAMSIAAAIAASYSISSGICIWPVLILLAIGLRLPRHWTVILCATGVLVAYLYFHGYRMEAGHANVGASLRHPLEMLFYAAAYVAMPVSRLSHGLGVLVGLGQIFFTAWLVVRFLFGRIDFDRLFFLALGILVFIITTACTTAAGRMNLGPPETAIRYSTPALLFWACFITICLLEKDVLRWGVKNRLAIVTSATVTWFILTIVPMVFSEMARLDALRPATLDAETALQVSIPDPTWVGNLYPAPAVIFDLVPMLRSHHLSVFSGTATETSGRRLSDMYVVAESGSACRGTVEFTEPVPDGVSLTGWGWDNTKNRTPDRVLIVSGGYIQGLGRFSRQRPDVRAAFGNSRMTASGWFGYMHLLGTGQEYTAYALLGDGKSVCPLADPIQLKRPRLAVFRAGTWSIAIMDAAGVRQTRVFNFGLPGDRPVAGDWDGSGIIRAGVFRNGIWYLDWNNNGEWDAADRQFTFGLPGDLPVVGDWDGSGRSKIGVFRNGTWILDWNGNGAYDAGDRTVLFGEPGDLPVVGNWDGSGKQRIGVFRAGIWSLDTNGNFQSDSGDQIVRFGLPGDQPVAGDWSGLKRNKAGVFRAGQWLLDYYNGNHDSGLDPKSLPFGLPGDQALAW
jgi:hypothetical protein